MRIKRFLSALLAVLFSLSLYGCQLAKEDQGEATSEDRFIGFLITRDWLDLYDTEAFVQDHLNWLSQNEAEILNNNAPYMGRLYATVQAETETDTSGAAYTSYHYSFPGVEGMAFFTPFNASLPESGKYICANYDEAICITKLSFAADDSLEQSCTIYIASNHYEKEFYLNPVYQTSDDQIYVESAGGYEFSGITWEGPFYSETKEEKTVITENGKSSELKCSTTVSFEILNPPTKIAVIQMDQNDQEVARAEYLPSKVPESITPESGTEYLIVKTFKTDENGASVVSREVISRESDTFFTFYAREDGICMKQSTDILW